MSQPHVPSLFASRRFSPPPASLLRAQVSAISRKSRPRFFSPSSRPTLPSSCLASHITTRCRHRPSLSSLPSSPLSTASLALLSPSLSFFLALSSRSLAFSLPFKRAPSPGFPRFSRSRPRSSDFAAAPRSPFAPRRSARFSARLSARFMLAAFLLVFLLAFICLLYTSPSPRDLSTSRMPSSA